MVNKASKNFSFECQLLGLTLSRLRYWSPAPEIWWISAPGSITRLHILRITGSFDFYHPTRKAGQHQVLQKAQGRVVASLQLCCFSLVWRTTWLSEPCNTKLVQPFSQGRRDLFTQTSELLIQFARGNLTESLILLLHSLYVGLQMWQD